MILLFFMGVIIPLDSWIQRYVSFLSHGQMASKMLKYLYQIIILNSGSIHDPIN